MGTAEGGDRSKSVVDRVAETEDNKRSKEEVRVSVVLRKSHFAVPVCFSALPLTDRLNREEE